jgi:hypothetical protein
MMLARISPSEEAIPTLKSSAVDSMPRQYSMFFCNSRTNELGFYVAVKHF